MKSDSRARICLAAWQFVTTMIEANITNTTFPCVGISRPLERTSHLIFVGVSAAAFAASVAVTILWSTAMSSAGAMTMPGGWTVSMAWMRMPGQTWPEAAGSFVGMWIVMMVAMMLPSLMPMLARYRQAVNRTNRTRLGRLTGVAGLGYFFVWTVIGIAVFPVGLGLTAAEMRESVLARVTPIAVGVVFVLAGAFQFSRWKAHQLACCHDALVEGHVLPAESRSAWKHGMRLGVHCCFCCANLMAILLVVGVMDLRAMGIVMAGITAERVAPAHAQVVRGIGVVVVVIGLTLIVRLIGLS